MERASNFGYYKIPLKFDQFFKKGAIPKASLEESIANMLHLILITAYGEYSFKPDFGCEIWEMDFENIQNSTSWANKFAAKVLEVFEDNEHRLKDFKVKVDLTQVETQSGLQGDGMAMKRQVFVELHARLKSSNEAFYFKDKIMISPFSPD